jgi:plasmid stabilization system protein ParE
VKLFKVHLTREAWEPIEAQVRYIAVEKKAPENASRWLSRLLDAIDTLEHLPARHEVDAVQSKLLGTNVYRMVFERTYLVHYTIEESRGGVYVLSFRHGARNLR